MLLIFITKLKTKFKRENVNECIFVLLFSFITKLKLLLNCFVLDGITEPKKKKTSTVITMEEALIKEKHLAAKKAAAAAIKGKESGGYLSNTVNFFF